MSKPRATIRDVARRAEVSVSTASNALNNKSEVAEETRRRVFSAARDLHWTPNALIRSLQSGRTNTIGVRTWSLATDPAHGITLSFLKGVCDQIALSGHDVLLYSNFGGENGVRADAFLDGRVDGVIVVPHGMTGDEMDRLAESHLPSVLVYSDYLAGRAGTVTIDNAAGIDAAVAHLIALGHRRIAFSAPLTTFDFRERRAAYQRGLEKRGLAFDPALVLVLDQYGSKLAPLCAEMLALPQQPTALIAGDDTLALRWRDALSANQKHVPHDFSLIGFDDSPNALTAPGLTTVRQPAEEVGRTAALFLERLIGGAAPDQCQAQLPVTLIVRGTTGPPA